MHYRFMDGYNAFWVKNGGFYVSYAAMAMVYAFQSPEGYLAKKPTVSFSDSGESTTTHEDASGRQRTKRRTKAKPTKNEPKETNEKHQNEHRHRHRDRDTHTQQTHTKHTKMEFYEK